MFRGISEEEKQHLRVVLLQLIDQENSQVQSGLTSEAKCVPVQRRYVNNVATHFSGWSQDTCMQIAVPIAVAVARVARIDYPKQWPLLFQDLLGSMNSQDTLRVRRVYLVLHHIIKELASMKLPADKQNFAQVCCHLNHRQPKCRVL